VNLRDTDDPRAMLRLQASCEAAKIQLSHQNEATINIDYLWPGQASWEGRITRAQFELINETFFRQCLRQVGSRGSGPVAVDEGKGLTLLGVTVIIPLFLEHPCYVLGRVDQTQATKEKSLEPCVAPNFSLRVLSSRPLVMRHMVGLGRN